MKRTTYLLALAALLFSTLAIAQTPAITWSTPIVVADGIQYGNIRPRIALNSNNHPIIIWGQTSGGAKVNVSYWNGNAFTTPSRINPANVEPRTATSDGPEMAVAGDTIFVVYSTVPANTGKVYVQRSLDGGVTFGDTVRVSKMTTDIPELPNVEIMAGGHPVVAYIKADNNWNNPQQVVSASTDGGATFGPLVDGSANSPGDPCECCPSSSLINGNQHFLLFRNNDNNIRDVFVATSTDGGASYATATDIDNASWNIPTCPSSGPVGHIANDSLVAVWMTENSDGYNKIMVGTMNTNNQQVGFNAELDDYGGTQPQNYPAIAGSSDTIGVVWQDNRNGNLDCYFSASISGASGFVPGELLNPTTNGTQATPHIAYANGVFHMVYQSQIPSQLIYRTATLTGTVGVNALAQKNKVSIYPNPIQNKATITLEMEVTQTVTIELFSITGQSVLQMQTSKSTVELHKSKLDTGIYLMQVRNANGATIAQEKVVVL